MGDTNSGPVEEKSETTETGAEDQGASQTDGGTDEEAEGAGTSENENGENADEAEGEGEKSKDKKPESKPTPTADEEPKTRKRNADFIIERKNRKIEKLKEKTDVAEPEEETTEDDDGMDPNDAKLIDSRIKSYLEPLAKKQMQDEDAQEISEYVKQNPDFAPYAAKVARYAQHPSRKDIPIKTLFYEAAGDDLLKIGAARGVKANAEAKKSQAGGGASKGTEAPKSVWDLSPEEFSAQQEALRNKQRG